MEALQGVIEAVGQPVQQIRIIGFMWNLILSALLSYLLSLIFIKYGRSLSNRRTLAANFVILTITTMFIITVVKSSLALSLGLVGALSIVRFRTAIKEPEELAYLFLCIAIGLGLGAAQTMVTLVAFVFVAIILIASNLFGAKDNLAHMFLSIRAVRGNRDDVKQIISILKKECEMVKLRRIDEEKDGFEALFAIEVAGVEKLLRCRERLHELNGGFEIQMLDNQA